MKFLTALVSLIAINVSMGYMSTLKHPAIVLVIALMCSFMPKNFVVLIGAFWVLMHSFSLAMECAVVVAAVFAIMFLLYFRFILQIVYKRGCLPGGRQPLFVVFFWRQRYRIRNE